MNTKQKIAVIIVCILMMGIVSAYASIVQPMYVAISGFTCSLGISSGTAKCLVDISPSNSGYTSILSVSLKRSINGASWTTIKSWSATGSGLLGAAVDESIAVSSGYQYKLFATGTIKNADGVTIETAYKNSSIKEY